VVLLDSLCWIPVKFNSTIR